MAARRDSKPETPRSRRPPATTPEERENQLISAAVDLAEEQLRAGTASAQVMTHYLKLGSSREKLEQKRLAGEVSLLETKREIMESAKRVEAMYGEALEAMSRYAGHEPPESDDDGED